MNPNLLRIFATGVFAAFAFSSSLGAAHHESSLAPEDRTRVLVLTDMGADPDDEQSLVRLLRNALRVFAATPFATRTSVARPLAAIAGAGIP